MLKPGRQFLIICEADDPTDTTWTGVIDGMTVYSGDDLKAKLERVGFTYAVLSRYKKG